MESRDDCVVMSLCDVNGSVVYATLSFSKGVVIWNNNMTSPRILANISRTSRGDVAHVRMFGESSYFTIEKSSSGKDTTLRISNDSCCHHIRAPCEIPSSQSHTRLIPLLLSSRGFHKTISSLMLFGTDKNVSDIVRVISFRDLNRPTIVRDSVIDFGTWCSSVEFENVTFNVSLSCHSNYKNITRKSMLDSIVTQTLTPTLEHRYDSRCCEKLRCEVQLSFR